MLFNKKLLMGLINISGVLLILDFLLNIVMYVWAYFGTPALKMYDIAAAVSANQPFVPYYNLLHELTTLVVLYIVLGVIAAYIKGSKLPEGMKK